MTKQEVLTLFRALNALSGLKGVAFSYAVAKNLRRLGEDVESMQKASELSKEFNEYETARIELAKEHAKKDADGKPVTEDEKDDNGKVISTTYVIANQKAFDKELEALRATHKEALDARQKQIDEFNALLNEESDVELHKIKLADVPQDITTEQMNGILPVIDE